MRQKSGKNKKSRLPKNTGSSEPYRVVHLCEISNKPTFFGPFVSRDQKRT